MRRVRRRPTEQIFPDWWEGHTWYDSWDEFRPDDRWKFIFSSEEGEDRPTLTTMAKSWKKIATALAAEMFFNPANEAKVIALFSGLVEEIEI